MINAATLLGKSDAAWVREKTGTDFVASELRSGGNNQVVKLQEGDRKLALKRYSNDASDKRDRVGTEFKALQFLAGHIPDQVPRVLAWSGRPPRLLFEWIEGASLEKPWQPDDLKFAAEFLYAVAVSSNSCQSKEFGPASEACFRLSDFTQQFSRRRSALSGQSLLLDYWKQFDATLDALSGKITENEQWLLQTQSHCLVPADFSLHNVIQRPEGGRTVIDFEYFGWDDPVKGVADFLLHPAMDLSPEQVQLFLALALPLFNESYPGFEERLQARLPWYALRWSLIVLNPFRDPKSDKNIRDERLRRACQYLDAAMDNFC